MCVQRGQLVTCTGVGRACSASMLAGEQGAILQVLGDSLVLLPTESLTVLVPLGPRQWLF